MDIHSKKREFSVKFLKHGPNKQNDASLKDFLIVKHISLYIYLLIVLRASYVGAQF